MPTEPWTDSRTPALALVARGDQIENVSPTEFLVRSQSHPDDKYTVSVVRNRWDCTCAFHRETRQSCIHILAVKFRAGFQQREVPEVGPSCDRCKSADVILSGRRPNKSGAVRRFKCKGCGAYFSGKEGFHKRRSDPDVIAKALDLYFRGTSFRQVAEHFRQAYGLKVSPMTVYRWVTHYSKLAVEWMNAQKAKVGELWGVDETVVNINGVNTYLWNLMDTETRFLLATHVSHSRSMVDTRVPFHLAKKRTDVRPSEIRSDGMENYPRAIRKEFGRPQRKGDTIFGGRDPVGYWTPHNPVTGITSKYHNNRIERLHGSEKDRIRVMRAFDNPVGCATLAEGWRAHYDMVRTHLTLGTTPGIAAGLPDLGTFRWRALIDLGVQRREKRVYRWETLDGPAASRIVTPLPKEARPDD